MWVLLFFSPRKISHFRHKLGWRGGFTPQKENFFLVFYLMVLSKTRRRANIQFPVYQLVHGNVCFYDFRLQNFTSVSTGLSRGELWETFVTVTCGWFKSRQKWGFDSLPFLSSRINLIITYNEIPDEMKYERYTVSPFFFLFYKFHWICITPTFYYMVYCFFIIYNRL